MHLISCLSFQFFLTSCIDINECQGENPCKDDKICINTDGSYECQTPNKFKVGNSNQISIIKKKVYMIQ